MTEFVPIVHDTSEPLRTFVVIGHEARTSGDFTMEVLPHVGRMDLMARCVRAALLVSHGLRRNARLYLVLLGQPRAPKTLRFDARHLRFMRPDERRLAMMLQKALSVEEESAEFVFVAPGIELASVGLDKVLETLRGQSLLVLDSAGQDIRKLPLPQGDIAFILGDHVGLTDEEKRLVANAGARAVRVGPVQIHADDAIAVVHNELDCNAPSPVGNSPSPVGGADGRGLG